MTCLNNLKLYLQSIQIVIYEIYYISQLEQQNMIQFVTGNGLKPSLWKKGAYALFIFGGFTIGYLNAKVNWSIKKQYINNKNMIEYECQDQINQLIQTTKKPAVIYYYLPGQPHHYVMRANMFKYSNLYPNGAIWVMVNLTQHLHQAKQALQTVIFPSSSYRLQVRFPKSELAIFKADQKQGMVLIKQMFNNRRQVSNYNVYQQQFRAFLQQNKIIQGQDPVKATLLVTQKALFSKH